MLQPRRSLPWYDVRLLAAGLDEILEVEISDEHEHRGFGAVSQSFPVTEEPAGQSSRDPRIETERNDVRRARERRRVLNPASPSAERRLQPPERIIGVLQEARHTRHAPSVSPSINNETAEGTIQRVFDLYLDVGSGWTGFIEGETKQMKMTLGPVQGGYDESFSVVTAE